MKKTPEEYAAELVDKYVFELNTSDLHAIVIHDKSISKKEYSRQLNEETSITAIACALIDVQNTIDALAQMSNTISYDSSMKRVVEYYQEVKQILENK